MMHLQAGTLILGVSTDSIQSCCVASISVMCDCGNLLAMYSQRQSAVSNYEPIAFALSAMQPSDCSTEGLL